MKKTIFFKISIGFLALIVLFSGVILLFTFNRIHSFYIDSITQELQTLGAAVEQDIIEIWEQPCPQKMNDYFKDFGQKIGTRITLINKQGIVLADSDEDPGVMDDHKFRPEIIRAFSGEPGQSIRFSKTLQKDMLYVALPVTQDGKVKAVLRLSRYLRDVNILISGLKKSLFRFILIVLFLSLLGSVLVTRSFTRPLGELSRAARRIALGDFETKVIIKNKDDLQELARSFNYMTEKIKSLFSEISQKKEELSSILLSIEEGLLVLDKNGKIILYNQSFQDISKIPAEPGKHYWEVLREPQFNEIVKAAADKGSRHSQEFQLNDRVYYCSINFLRMREEMVITFHDITNVKNIEKIKRDFVVNVSHELRTPLTAIKGFLETLEDEVEGRPLDYIQTIKRNTDRLIHIVKDLLLLSEVEDKVDVFKKEKFEMAKLVRNVVNIFEPRIKEKGLEIKINIEAKLPRIQGDPFMLEQVLINLLDNALKYTESGRITIELKQQNRHLTVLIQDTGIGIPKEDLPRIFERFYVVDKSRSRSMGGTGLGLSIVKHIVQLHGGSIDAESTAGAGTKFNIRLPLG
jgi:two-component system phosphate regulon sensor histidine kinase PhoR